MTRINGGSPHSAQVHKPEAPKAQAPAPKAQAPAAKNTVTQPKGDRFDTKSKGTAQAASKPVGPPPERITKNFSASGRAQINKLANSAQAKVTTNQDGSETRKLEGKVNNGKGKAEAELTTKKGLLRESQTKYSKTTTTTVEGGTDKKSYTATSKSDMFGRTTSSQTTENATTRGGYTHSQKTTEARDQWGIQKDTKTEGHAYKSKGPGGKEVTSGVNLSETTDSRGNKSAAREDTTTTKSKDGKTTVTTTTKNSSGTELNTTSTAKFEEGKYTIGEQADWKKTRSSTERSYNKEITHKEKPEPGGFDPANKNDRLSQAQKGLNLVGDKIIPKKELSKGEIPKDQMHENNRIKGPDGKDDPNTFVGTRHGVAGKHEVTVGGSSIFNATGNYEAKAGAYAEKKLGNIDADKGGKQLDLAAKAEVKFAADGKAKVDLNGLDAEGKAEIGGSIEASAKGRIQSKSVTVAGEKLNVGAEGTVKVSAQAKAEVAAKAKITRNPPTAIVEGSAGASAVVKAEAEGKINAGPFAVKGNIYGSAGAEATAKGSIGYENGKIKISGSLGAAVGLGAGGGVGVEVDVKQIGNMAKNAAQPVVDQAKKVADVNGDGKLGIDDAKQAARNVKDTAVNAAREVKNQAANTYNNAKAKVSNAANTVKSWFRW